MIIQLKIFDANDQNIWEEVDGGVECISEEAASAMCDYFNADGNIVEEGPGAFEDIHAVPAEMMRFATEHEFSPELITAIGDVVDNPIAYSTIPFALFAYED